jgi:hypothetical protein
MSEPLADLLESIWRHLQAGSTDDVRSLLDSDGSWDDPLFDAARGASSTNASIAALSAWYRGKVSVLPAPIEHLQTTADTQRIVVESVLTLNDGVVWNQSTLKTERAQTFQLAVAVVGDRSRESSERFSALRIYFGTWSVLNGKPRVRVGPIAPGEGREVRRIFDRMPTIYRYFDYLERADPRILEQFEPDGYFREPSSNFACGSAQLQQHFSRILKLGGVGIEFLTATRQGDRLGLELQTIQWGTKKMTQPQAGFACYELGPHGKIQCARVYDSVVPPEL